MQRKIITVALGVVLALGACAAYAGGSQPNDIRIGAYFVHYDSTATDITGPFTPPGLNTSIGSVTTLYLAYVRTLATHWQVEFAFGYPPVTYAKGKGPATVGSLPYNGKEIASIRWVSPTLLLEYAFFSPRAKWRPFVGLGVNYTRFIDRQITAAGAAISGGPTSISLPSSVGPAVTAGVTYRFSGRWHFTASYSVAQVNSRLTTDTAGILRSNKVHFWPNAAVVSVGYSF
jgi:outer membrane protein